MSVAEMKPSQPMKLFVWADPYSVSYGSSLVFAVGLDAEDAKKNAAAGKGYTYGKYERECSMSVSAESLGDPTRVLDLPCAEWHEWSE